MSFLCNLCQYLVKTVRAECWECFVKHLLASDEEIEAAGLDLGAHSSKFNP